MPPSQALDRLRRLHASAILLADQAPELIANADTSGGLEAELIESFVACVSAPPSAESTLAWRQHTAIMKRFRAAVEENTGKPLYLPELCAAIGASDRTLRLCCQESLGMGPKRYLFLRRMHMVRRALQQAASDAVSVTTVATRYGFWELGRFAGEYRSLFGETPSATLRAARSQR
jgi:AraC-like DNA-binding protein